MKTTAFYLWIVALFSLTYLQLGYAAPAPVYENLFSFNDARTAVTPENPVAGDQPNAALLQSRDGNFYGTTMQGGASDCGTIFKMTPSGEITTLIEFTGTAGDHKGNTPMGALVEGVDGNFYGTTSAGGQFNDGTIFRMTPIGQLTTIVEFTGDTGDKDANGVAIQGRAVGAAPVAGLTLGKYGSIYGTTSSSGGINKVGTVFRINNIGGSSITVQTLVKFSGLKGKSPKGRLLLDWNGLYLYGTTSAGGEKENGTVFMIDISQNPSPLTTLFSFGNIANDQGDYKGSTSNAGLVQTGISTFYGTTSSGGDNNAGTVFKIDTAGTKLKFMMTLVNFTGTGSGLNNRGKGCTAELYQGSDGMLYGTTSKGGKYDTGTVFRMSPNGFLKTLVDFTFNGENKDGDSSATALHKGAYPAAALIQGSDGIFYSTTPLGCAPNHGSVFRMSVSNDGLAKLTTLAIFTEKGPPIEGNSPSSDMVKGGDGCFYGTTKGGATDDGTIFKMTTDGILTTLAKFINSNIPGEPRGRIPNALLYNKKDGNFYGTTIRGGRYDAGTCFVMRLENENTYKFYSIFDFTDNNVDTTRGIKGLAPTGALAQDVDGNMYGMTSEGGDFGFGSIFQLSPAIATIDALGNTIITAGTVNTVLHFSDTPTSWGRNPVGGLFYDNITNFLFGTTSAGGNKGKGTVFSLDVGNNTVKTLAHFGETLSGSNPQAGVLLDGDYIYGTTAAGGSKDLGTVFRVSTKYDVITQNFPSETLHEFDGTYKDDSNNQHIDGSAPIARLVKWPGADNAYFGTTSGGGVYGDGMVFEIMLAPDTQNWIVSPLNQFSGVSQSDVGSATGSIPVSGLAMEDNGNFYGTTSSGGVSSSGTVFMMTPSGALTTFVEFQGVIDVNQGSAPEAGLVQDKTSTDGSVGNFYGTTSNGGTFGYGTAFMMTPGGTLKTLVNFTGSEASNKGSHPLGELVQGADGCFYGTTSIGGASDCGTVFKLTKAGTLTTLVEFTGNGISNIGRYPSGGLIIDTSGDLYGTTENGGTGTHDNGTIFKIGRDGLLTTLVEFDGTDYEGYNGRKPRSLVLADDGNFYGTTFSGGTVTQAYPLGAGTIFRMRKSGEFKTLFKFKGIKGNHYGNVPSAGLLWCAENNCFYGMTQQAGDNLGGTVFKMTIDPITGDALLTPFVAFGTPPANSTTTNLICIGDTPRGKLVRHDDGTLYGITEKGGKYNNGTIFKILGDESNIQIIRDFSTAVGVIGNTPGSPYAPMVEGSDLNLYGSTRGPDGNIFRLVFAGTPLVTDLSAISNSIDSETLGALVNPRGMTCDVKVEYWIIYNNGTLSDPMTEWVAKSLYGYKTNVVGTSLSGLMKGSNYGFHFVVEYDNGKQVSSSNGSFTITKASPPTVNLAKPGYGDTDATSTSMILRDKVSSDSPVTVYWEWGTDGITFLNKTPVIALAANADTPPFTITGLAKGSLYHYRVVASNTTYGNGNILDGGTTISPVNEFNTPIECLTTIDNAKIVGSNLILSGTVNAKGGDATVQFFYSSAYQSGYTMPTMLEPENTNYQYVESNIPLHTLNEFDTYTYQMIIKSFDGKVTTLSSLGAFNLPGLSALDHADPGVRPDNDKLFSISVNTLPSEVTGGWRFKGEPFWRSSNTGRAVKGLEQSNRVIEFKPVHGYDAPSPKPIAINSALPKIKIVVGKYIKKTTSVKSALIVNLFSSSGLIPTSGRWRIVSVPANEWKKSGDWVELDQGSYQVEFIDIENFNVPPSRSISITDGKDKIAYSSYESKSVLGNSPNPVTDTSPPECAYVGQILSDSGSGSGFVVKDRVVVTVGHVVFDSATLSFVTDLQWLCQRDSTNFEPRPLIPRGVYLMDDYAAARREANLSAGIGKGTSVTQNRDVATLFFNESAGRGGYSGYLATGSDSFYNEFLTSLDNTKFLAGYPTVFSKTESRMYATDPIKFSMKGPQIGSDFDPYGNRYQTYTASEINGRSGMSGCPLFVRRQYEDRFYPAGIYIGGDNQIVVRAIDTDVAKLITHADISSTLGDNNDGGTTYGAYSSGGNSNGFGNIKVTIMAENKTIAAEWSLIKHETNMGDVTVGTFISGDIYKELIIDNPQITYSLKYLPFGAYIPAPDYAIDKSILIPQQTLPLTATYNKTTIPSSPAIEILDSIGRVESSNDNDFGTVTVGSLGSNHTFTIKNNGYAPLSNLAITVDGENNADFQITQPLVTSITGPGGSTTFKVRFAPGGVGNRNAIINIASNDNNNPFVINLNGVGSGPEIAVEQPEGTNLTRGTAIVDYGYVKVNASATKTFTIKNFGTTDLMNLAVSKKSGNVANFTLGHLATTLAAGASTTFDVSFKPTALGSRAAVIQIVSNDYDENPFDINLTGSAGPEIVIEQPAGTELIDGSASAVHFGSVTMGGASTRLFTIKNFGSTSLKNLIVTKKSGNVASFTLGHLTTTLAAGTSTTFKVIFKPNAVGPRTAVIQIASNDANENPFDINLTGNGIAASAPTLAAAAMPQAKSLLVAEATPESAVTTVEVLDGVKYLALTVTKTPGPQPRRIVEVSPNLLDWYSGRQFTTVMQNDAYYLRTRDNTPLGAGTKRFIRLKGN